MASVRTSTSSLSSDLTLPEENNSHNITISHVNINSITCRARLDELSFFASLNDIDVVCLSETKLDDNVHPSLFLMDNFHDPMTRHRDRNGGGVAIYVRNNIPARRLKDLELSDVEWVWCLLKIQKTTLLLCSVYVPPNLTSSQYSLFINKLTESISLAQTYSPDNIIILGDFNAGNTFLDPKFLNHSPLTPYEITLHDEILAYNFDQLINQPTRYSCTSNTANLRDLIIISHKSMVSDSGVLPAFSKIDHVPTFVSLLIEPPSISKQTIQYWDYGRTDIDKLTRILMDIDWDNLLDCDLDKATENFTEALMNAARASIPQKCFSINSKDKP